MELEFRWISAYFVLSTFYDIYIHTLSNVKVKLKGRKGGFDSKFCITTKIYVQRLFYNDVGV